MDLNNLESIMREHGVPASSEDIIRIVQECRGVDVSSIFEPVLANRNNQTHSALTVDNSLSPHEESVLESAYTDYRSNRNWSTARFGLYNNILSVFRTSSPQGPIAGRNATRFIAEGVNSYARTQGIQSVNGTMPIPVPIVLDQNTRVDWEPSQIGEVDHIRIQLLFTAASAGSREDISLPKTGLSGIAFPPAFSRDQIISNGWEPIVIDGHVIGALLPESIDPTGRHAIVLGFEKLSSWFNQTGYLVSEVLAHLSDRWSRTEQDSEDAESGPSEDDLELVNQLRLAQSFALSLNSRMSTLESTIAGRRNDITNYTTLLANAMRNLDNESVELQSLKIGMVDQVIERSQGMSGIAETIESMRPVESAILDSSNGGLTLNVKTNFFGMQGESIFGVMLIPRITYKINLMATSFDRGISIYCDDADYYGNRHIHPHLGRGYSEAEYSVCWGNAGREPLPDAWARRDWVSLVRLILSFQTQYNHRSPLTRYDIVDRNLSEAPRTGWITEEELAEYGSQDEDNPHEATVDLIGASDADPF